MYNLTGLMKKTTLILTCLFISAVVYSQNLNDSEIKKNITAIENPLKKLVQLQPKSFEYKTDQYKHLKLQHGKKYGFLAEDFQHIFPDLVVEKSVSYMFGKNAYRNSTIKTIDEQSLIPLLVASIKEQQLQIDKLTTELEALKNKNASAFAE
jgi:hypothetical protein